MVVLRVICAEDLIEPSLLDELSLRGGGNRKHRRY